MNICKWIGLVFLLGYAINFYVIFLEAMSQGYVATVDFNSIGEGKFEFILLVVSLPFIVYYLWEADTGDMETKGVV